MKKNIVKKGLVLTIILLFVGVSFQPVYAIDNIKKSSKFVSNGNVFYVGGIGPNNYTRIQDAVYAANVGDTVFVYDDSSPYNENIILDKSINLIGENRDTTILGGDFTELADTVYISADWVNISEFTILSYYEYFCGIRIDSCYNKISYNIFAYSWCGIHLLDGSSNNTITDNIINEDSYLNGIWLSNSNNNIIKDNLFSLKFSALTLSYSSNNIIIDNYFLDNEHCIKLEDQCMNNTIAKNILMNITCCICISLRSSDGNLIIDNMINYNTNWGNSIGIYNSDSNIVKGNLISYCGNGISFIDSFNNIVICNNITNCEWYGISLSDNPQMCNKELGNQLKSFRCNNILNKYYSLNHFLSSDNNTFFHNNFVNNNQNAIDECSNKWDNGYQIGGNYWDDYSGKDFYSGPNQDIPGSDGIGDTPYHIYGGNNVDRYPLMIPLGENHPPNTPEIDGKRSFKVREGGEYPYKIYSKDLDGDNVWFLINWSDGTQEWIGPYKSDEEITINVSIPLKKGTYDLFKVKSKDVFGAESDWAILEIIVLRNKASYYYSFFMKFLRHFPLLERLLISFK